MQHTEVEQVNSIGIMQGRLTPPQNGRIQTFPIESWHAEFKQAAECGLELIEWIYDTKSFALNPIMSLHGIEEISAASSEHGVRVVSLCADYFMEQPLIRVAQAPLEGRLMTFQKLIDHCSMAGIRFIGIPFVDNASIRNEKEIRDACSVLKQLLPLATDKNIVLALETSLSPADFSKFLDMLDHPNAKVNYDTGNSASLGYDIREEIAAYGEAIATIHIKDRVCDGGTVPLGMGDTDFAAAFDLFGQIDYTGPYVLQAAREGDEVETARKNLKFVKKYLQES